MSLPSREVWIEIVFFDHVNDFMRSLPSREVWIEIL